MGIQLCVIYVFPLAALNVCFLCLNFWYFTKIFVAGCFIGFILFGTPWCVGIQGAISFPHLMDVFIVKIRKAKKRDFPGSPVVKNPPSSAGDEGSIPGQRTISHMPQGNY